MSISHTRRLLSLAMLVFTARFVDATTGQPMPNLDVTLSGAAHAHSKTDDRGRITLASLRPGSYTLRVESDDVPPQAFAVDVKGPKTTVTLRICSMTLDYHCATGGGGGS